MIRPGLVGRDRERTFLHEELSLAMGGHGRLVVLGGEAGIGKTTLIRMVAGEAAERGALVLAGHCYDLTTTPPYGPWMDLAANVPEETASLPVVLRDGRFEGVTSQAALFNEVRRSFEALARATPVVLILEDFHWADLASLELLRFLTTRLHGLPMLVLVTYRIDELTRHQPLYHHLPALISASDGNRFDLRGLDATEQRDLIRSICQLPPDVEPRLVAYISHHAEGNPFFAGELLRALQEEQLLTPGRQGWELAPLDHVVVPPMVRQVIETRFTRLSAATRETLTLAAVIGQEISIDLWADLAGIGQDAMIAVIEEASEAHLLESDARGESVSFVHALTRDAAYEAVLPLRRRGLHLRVAEAAMQRPRPDPDVVAYHLRTAGDPRAPAWLEQAGNRAMRAYAWMLASERFAAAADALAPIDGAERERAWLLYRAARLLRMADPGRGLRIMDDAQRLARICGDPLLAADSFYSRGVLLGYTGAFAEALDAMKAGIALLEDLPEDEQRVDPTVALALADALPDRVSEVEAELRDANLLLREHGIHHRRGSLPWWASDLADVESALTIGVDLVAKVRDAGLGGNLIASTSAHALQGMAVAYALIGEVSAAREAFAAALQQYHGIDHHGVVAICHLRQLRALTLVYDVLDPGVRRSVADAAVQAMQLAGGAFSPEVPTRTGELALLVLEGRWDDVRDVLGECPVTANAYLDSELQQAAAALAFHQDDRDALWRQIDRAFPEGPGTPPGTRSSLLKRELARFAAASLLAEGDAAAAARWMDAHDAQAPDARIVLGRPDALTLRSQIAWAADDAAAATALADQAVADARATAQPLSLINVLRWRGELHRLLGRPAAGHAALAEAIELATSGRLDLECERTERVLHGSHSSWPATGNTVLARRRFEQGKSPDPFGLTPREREVLRLVAQGLTDAAVANALFISPRTASQHLRSVYAKLDVSSRSAATRVAMEHGLG